MKAHRRITRPHHPARPALGAGLLALAVRAGPTGGADAVFERSGSDGAVELTNIPDDHGNYQQVTTPPAPPASPAPADDAAVAPQDDAPEQPAASGISEGPMGARLRALYDAAQKRRSAQSAAPRPREPQ